MKIHTRGTRASTNCKVISLCTNPQQVVAYVLLWRQSGTIFINGVTPCPYYQTGYYLCDVINYLYLQH